MERTPHFHVLDIGEGDWGAYSSRAKAVAAAKRIVEQTAEYLVEPMRSDELTIMAADEWCSLDDEPCYEDRNEAIRRTLSQTPEWTHEYRDDPPAAYRIDGKRVPIWKMMSRLSTDQMTNIWPFTGHPVAMAQWRFDNMIMDPEICRCATRGHRKKGCLIGPNGRKCSICGALYTEYGNAMRYCPACDDWKERRERYLADVAVASLANAAAAQQIRMI